MTSPVVLELLEDAVNRNAVLDKAQIAKLRWNLRYIEDPFIQNEYTRLLADYGRTGLQGGEIMAYVRSRNYERAYSILLELVDQKNHDHSPTFDAIPIDWTVCRLLQEAGAVEEVISLIPKLIHRGYNPSPSTWLHVLEICLDYKYYDGIRLVWESCVSNHKLRLSSGWIIRMLVAAGEAKDLDWVQTLARDLLEAGVESAVKNVAVSILNGLTGTDDNNLERMLWVCSVLKQAVPTLSSRDLPNVGDFLDYIQHDPCALVKVVAESNGSEPYKTLMMNLVLDRYHYSWAPSGVLHTYRKFVCEGIAPDVDTFRIVINAAYRLGNAKKLTYTIYREMVDRGVTPSRGIFETIIKSQLVGNNYKSVLFFVREMRQYKVMLRESMRQYLIREFEALDDTTLTMVLGRDVDRQLSVYDSFPDDEALTTTASRKTRQFRRYSSTRDMLNTHSFVTGWASKDLRRKES
jgi:hypothetical protein